MYSIKLFETRVRIKTHNGFHSDIDPFDKIGLIIDFDKKSSIYTVEFEYQNKNGEKDTDIAFLKRTDFIIISL